MNSPGGAFRFESAASGSANADITWSEKLRITSGGAVGINTTVPSTAQYLTIDGESNYKAGIFYRQAGVDQYRLMCEGGTGHVYYDTFVDGGDHVFRTDAQSTGGSEKLRITEEGKVGINTSAPEQKLHIFSGGGNVDNGGLLLDVTGGTAAQSSNLTVRDMNWRVNRGTPLFHLWGWNSGAVSNGSGAYTTTLAKIQGNFTYTHEADNDKAYGLYVELSEAGAGGVKDLYPAIFMGQGSNTNCKVGIGHSQPDSTLVVAGRLKCGYAAMTQNWESTEFTKAYEGGLDICCGNGSRALNVWDDNSTSVPRFSVLRNGQIGVGTGTPGTLVCINKSGAGSGGVHINWHNGNADEKVHIQDTRWKINRTSPLLYLDAYAPNQDSQGSGSYNSTIMRIKAHGDYVSEVHNDTMYGLVIDMSGMDDTGVATQYAIHADRRCDLKELYIDGTPAAFEIQSDGGSQTYAHWYGNAMGGNYSKNGDNRSPKPDEFRRGRGISCFFTQKNGNSSGNYMDALHFATYSDSSGGNPNLFMINKSNNNVRIIRGGWDSSADMGSSTYNNYSIYDLDYTSGSDLRLKEDINTIASNTALSLVTQLRPVTFKWKDEYINSGFSKNEKENEYTEEEPLTEGGPKRQVRKTLSSSDKVVNVGLIAQEVESVIPTVVHDGHVGLKDEDGANYKNIDYDKLVPYLIGAIKELKSENDALKARVTILESS